jgi:uncharacterized OsmC-like protein
MPDIEVWYGKGDRFLVQMRDHHVIVDQPTGNGGDDMGATPTEMFVASLATCIGFYAERYLRNHDIDPAGLHVAADFEMAEGPRRIGSITIRLRPPRGFPTERREILQAVIERCTVHNSMVRPPTIQITVERSSHAVVA